MAASRITIPPPSPSGKQRRCSPRRLSLVLWFRWEQGQRIRRWMPSPSRLRHPNRRRCVRPCGLRHGASPFRPVYSARSGSKATPTPLGNSCSANHPPVGWERTSGLTCILGPRHRLWTTWAAWRRSPRGQARQHFNPPSCLAWPASSERSSSSSNSTVCLAASGMARTSAMVI